jgi:hypothetical protein
MTKEQAQQLKDTLNSLDVKPATGIEDIDDALDGLSFVPLRGEYALDDYSVTWAADQGAWGIYQVGSND